MRRDRSAAAPTVGAPRATPGAARAAVVALSVLGALAGCATAPKAPPYLAPQGIPVARLAIRGAVGNGDRFGIFIYDEQEHCRLPHVIGMGTNTGNPSTTTLAAGQPATVEFLLQKQNKQFCSVRWTFVPATGKTYVLAGRATDRGCAAAVLDASDPDALHPDAGALRRDTPGNACIPLAQARSPASLRAGVDPTTGEAVLRPSATADDLKGLMTP